MSKSNNRIVFNKFKAQQKAKQIFIAEHKLERSIISMKKMHSFLVNLGIALDFDEIQKLPTFNVQKLLDPEYSEILQTNKFFEKCYSIADIDTIKEYNSFFPPMVDQVYYLDDEEMGPLYFHVHTIRADEISFDSVTHIYKIYNGTFWLDEIVNINNMSYGSVPEINTKIKFSGGRAFFLDRLPAEHEFTREELEYIKINLKHATKKDPDESQYRKRIFGYIVNILRFHNSVIYCYKTNNNLRELENDVFFKASNFSIDLLETNVLSKTRNEKILDFYKDACVARNSFSIVPKNCTDKLIATISSQDSIISVKAATGFVYSSGIRILENTIKEITSRNGSIELVIGALQNCNKGSTINKMDLSTAHKLNEMIDSNFCKIYTYRPSFYHGKYYQLDSSDKTYIIIGSSNISKSAYHDNFELDMFAVFEKTSPNNIYKNWFEELKAQCEEISHLNENEFQSTSWISELDAYKMIMNKKIGISEIRERIKSLTDEETRFRLNLWMEHEPNEIYDNLDIPALSEYTMFIFGDNNLAVFESFEPGNAFYVFNYYSDLDSFILNAKDKSKAELRLTNDFIFRGNHSTPESLQRKIDLLFEKEYV